MANVFEAAKDLIQTTAPGSSDRLTMRLLIEADGDIRAAFHRFVAEIPIEESLWLVFLWMIIDDLSPDDLRALAEAPVRLPSEYDLFRQQERQGPS